MTERSSPPGYATSSTWRARRAWSCGWASIRPSTCSHWRAWRCWQPAEAASRFALAEAARAHEDGHTIGLIPAGSRHESTRNGSLRRRTTKRVYAPISAPLETRTSSVTPTRRKRSNCRNRTQVTRPAGARRLAAATGQPRRRHRTVMRASPGASTASLLSFTPLAKTLPTILTIGNGSRKPGGGTLMWIVWLAMLESRSPLVTRNLTVWSAGVVNVVLIADGPAWNAPRSVRSQANAVIGLVRSVEVDTSETVSPVCGVLG